MYTDILSQHRSRVFCWAPRKRLDENVAIRESWCATHVCLCSRADSFAYNPVVGGLVESAQTLHNFYFPSTMLSAALRRVPRAPRFARSLATGTTTSGESSSSSGRFGRYLRNASFASSIALSAYILGSLYPPQLATFISPRPGPPPLDPNDSSTIAHLESLEDALLNLPLLRAHRSRPDAQDWYEARPYTKLPEERRVHSLTAGALRGPGKLALPPVVRAKKDESENIFFVHVGRSLCGHEGIIHGGLLATLLDESLGRIVSHPCLCSRTSRNGIASGTAQPS